MNKKDQNNPDHPGENKFPKNELATETRMEFNELITLLSNIQDELNLRGLEEPAQLVHRALNKLTLTSLNVQLAEKIAKKNTTPA